MILFPAIDLKDGQCVRLKQGEMDEATIFNNNPAAQAKLFQDQGFEYLHIVDLNGAFEGKPVNGAAVDEILQSISIPIQMKGMDKIGMGKHPALTGLGVRCGPLNLMICV